MMDKIVFKIFDSKIQLFILELKEIDNGYFFRGRTRNGIIFSGECDKEFNHN